MMMMMIITITGVISCKPTLITRACVRVCVRVWWEAQVECDGRWEMLLLGDNLYTQSLHIGEWTFVNHSSRVMAYNCIDDGVHIISLHIGPSPVMVLATCSVDGKIFMEV